MISGGSRPSANVVALIFQLNEASYLAGMAAGAVTRSGVVGMVGGVEIPTAKGTFVAFEAGVKAVREDATVLETFIGSWDDVSAAKEAAAAQLREGADVLIHNVDAASFGFFQSVREARERGRVAWAFGMNRDQNDVAPDVIVGSAVIDYTGMFLQTAEAWRDGTLGSEPVYSGLATGTVEHSERCPRWARRKRIACIGRPVAGRHQAVRAGHGAGGRVVRPRPGRDPRSARRKTARGRPRLRGFSAGCCPRMRAGS